MEDKFLEEILKDTYTLESFKKRAMALKLKIEKKIFKSSDQGENESTHDLTVGVSSLDRTSSDSGKPTTLQSGFYRDEHLPEVGKSSLNEAQEWAWRFDEKIIDEINGGNFRQLFEVIDHFIAEATPLTIYFVFIPDDDQIKEIGEWLRECLKNPKLIFGVKIDPNLIGGCAIAYKGVYKDYSLKAKIGANKEKLVEEFRKYLSQ